MNQTQRWDLDARKHRTRLQRLDKFRTNILSDPDRPVAAADNGQHADGDHANVSGDDRRGRVLVPPEPEASARACTPLLLDLSPEREGRAAQTTSRRRQSAAEAIKGANLALRDVQDWKESVLAERAAVTAFLREIDPALAFRVGASCHDGDIFGHCEGEMLWCEAEVIVANAPYLASERIAESKGPGRMGRHGSWATAGAWTALASSTIASTAHTDREESAEEARRDDGGDSVGRYGIGAFGFLRALAALDPCVRALRRATRAAQSGDRMSMALETIREHVKATLIDLMDLETSLPGDGAETDDQDNENGGRGGGAIKKADPVLALTSADAGALDTKVAGLLQRLAGGGAGSGVELHGDDDAGSPPSLANVYEKGLGGAATASEAEVDTTESLTAIALRMVVQAAAGPLLWALDDAYQVCARGGRGSRSVRASQIAALHLLTVIFVVVSGRGHIVKRVFCMAST